MTDLSRYDRENVRHTINGYLMPATRMTKEAAFNKARSEAVRNLEEYARKVESMTFTQFTEKH